MMLILIFSISASFANEETDVMQADNSTGMEPVMVVEESTDDSSSDENMLSVSGLSDSNDELGAVDEDNLGNTELNSKLTGIDYEVDLDDDYSCTASITISRPKFIDGHGHYIDFNHMPYHLIVKTSNIVFKNITFKNSRDSAVSFSSDCTNLNVDFIDCIFENNCYSKRGLSDVNPTNNYGGALRFNGDVDSVNFTNCVFNNNYLESSDDHYGGAICFLGTVNKCNFTDVSFFNNFVDSFSGLCTSMGGAIYFKKTVGNAFYNNVNFTECKLKYTADPRTSYCGGAICYDGGLTASEYIHCNFINNSAKNFGGSIYVNGGLDHSKFINCSFKDNYAQKTGAAIYISGDSTNNKYINVTFSGNRAQCYNTTYDYSTRDGGGAIYIGGTSTDDTFTSVNFTNNRIEVNLQDKLNNKYKPSSYYGGGAIYIGSTTKPVSNLTFSNVNFTGNGAVRLMMNNNKDSYRGGAIYYACGYSDVNYINCNFKDNSVTRSGGAIYVDGDSIRANYINVSFADNKAEYLYYSFLTEIYGGADIFISGASRGDSFTNVTFNKTDIGQVSNTNINGAVIYFRGTAENLKFNNVNFTDNSAEGSKLPNYGGAIYYNAAADVEYSSCNFVNHKASYGGAIYYNAAADVEYSSCNFKNHEASYGGGAIYYNAAADAVYSHCDFVNNEATMGGAIYYSTEVNGIKYLNCTFKNNTASGSGYNNGGGGALYYGYIATDMEYIQCEFINNTANYYGGSIYVKDSSARIKFDDVNFTSIKNPHTSRGGFIYAKLIEYYVFNKVNFNGAQASSGGAIYSDTSISHSIFNYTNFTDNYASSKGGVMYCGGGFTSNSFNHVNFTRNKAKNNGGVFCFDSYVNSCKFTDVIMSDNSAERYGGDIYFSKSDNVIFENSTFINNSAFKGGAVFFYGSPTNITFKNVEFRQNNASEDGGAICVPELYTVDIKLDKVNFTANTAKNGGASYSKVPISANGCTFKDNTASNLGGAVYYYSVEDVELGVNNFINNSAKYGGAIYSDYTSNVSVSANFINNSADYGGAIYFKKSEKVTFNQSHFTNNTAIKGGAIWIYSDNEFYILNSSFTNNSADTGAAIYTDNKVNVLESNFTQNTANHGSAMYLDFTSSTVAVITDSLFELNTGNVIEKTYSSDSYDEDGNPIYDVIEIKNSLFNKNNAYSLYLNNIDLSVKYSNFTDNKIGVLNLMNSGAYLYECHVNNTLANNGAFRLYNSSAYLEQMIFANNTAKYGGAIYSDISYVEIHSSQFIKNSAGYGGAIYVNGNNEMTSICLQGVDFISNVANVSAGAIYAAEDSMITLSGGNIYNNSAKLSGGAIFISASAGLQINGISFELNNAQKGSAIDNRGELDISDSQFFKNKANSTLNIHYNKITDKIEISLTLGDNYIHAISSNTFIYFNNVDYFEYADNSYNTDIVPSEGSYFTENKDISVIFYGADGNELERKTVRTNSEGKLELDKVDGFDKVVAFTDDDAYYWSSYSQYILSEKGDFEILQELIINNTDGILNLERDYTYSIGLDTITDGIIVYKPIVINGNGYKIDALFKSRIFNVVCDNVVFNNIDFVNASGKDGSFIYADGVNDVNINKCSFSNPGTVSLPSYDGVKQCPVEEYMRWIFESNSEYLPLSEAYEYGYNGGAIYLTGSNLTIKNSDFNGIGADIGGTLYFVGENLTVEDSKWNNSLGVFGGALYIKGNLISIDDCLFNNSFAAFSGGSILAFGENFNITNSNFTDNAAFGKFAEYYVPGPIIPSPDIPIIIGMSVKPVMVTLGDLKTDGGLVPVIDPGIIVVDPVDPVDVPSLFEYGGGAISIHAADVRLINNRFEYTAAHSVGGAIIAEGENYLIENSVFINCFANYWEEMSEINDKSIPRGGGAIYSLVSNITIESSSFDSCTASLIGSGGAVYADGEETVISNSNFTACHSIYAGAVFIDEECLNSKIINSKFRNNTASQGGAIVWYASSGRLEHSTFDNNNATLSDVIDDIVSGGAVEWIADSAVIYDCNFTGNYVISPIDRNNLESILYDDTGFGGAAYIMGGNIRIDECHFRDNDAKSGGALYIEVMPVSSVSDDENPRVVSLNSLKANLGTTESYYVLINDCEFTNNFASSGGAVYVKDSDVIGDSFSGRGSGDLWHVLVNHSEFSDNIAGIAGAIYLISDNSKIYDSIFKNNVAMVGGAVVSGIFMTEEVEFGNENTVMKGYSNQIINSTFISNEAETAGAVCWLTPNGIIDDSHFISNNNIEMLDKLNVRFVKINGWLLEEYEYDDILKEYFSDKELNKNLGGAICWIGDSGVVYSCDFTQNTAIKGGAIYWCAENGQIIDSNFTYNNAISGEPKVETYESSKLIKYDVNFTDFNPSEYFGYYCEFTQYELNTLMNNIYSEVLLNVTQKYGIDSENVLFIAKTYDVSPELGQASNYDISIHYFFELYEVLTKEITKIAYGGAVYCDNYYGNIQNSIFDNNSADKGGAVFWNYGEGEIIDSTFKNNSAVLGGAIYCNDGGKIKNSIFKDNHVIEKELIDIEVVEYYDTINEYNVHTDINGVEYESLDDFKAAYYVYIYSKYCEDNTEPDVSLHSFKEMRVENTEPQVTQQVIGGGSSGSSYTEHQSVDKDVNITIYVYFIHYLVSDSYNGSSQGGAIYFNNKGYVDLSNFTDNTAEEGGAIYNNGVQTEIYGSNFTDNTAVKGGAVYNNGNNTLIGDSNFASNNADEGGAVYNNASVSQISGSEFIKNSAIYGGAVYNAGHMAGIISSMFLNNTAQNGGAIYAKEYTRILGSEFRYNKADIGSAVYVNYDDIYVKSSTFLQNQARSISMDISSDVNGKDLTVNVAFKGNDNLINAFFVENAYSFEDVTYWSSQNLDATNSDISEPAITSLEDGIDVEMILINVKDSMENSYINITNVMGNAVFDVSNLKSGRYYIIVSHKEDDYYTEIGNNAVVEIGDVNNPLNVEVQDIFYNENETVKITLNPDAEGNVTILINDDYYNYYDLVNGEVSFNISGLSVGSYNITVMYNGSDKYDPNTEFAQFKVSPINSTIAISTIPLSNGENVPINITVGPYDDVTGLVFVTIKDVFGTTLTLNTTNELKTVVKKLADGNYTITVHYVGDNNYLPSTNSTNITVEGSEITVPVTYTINATIADITYPDNATAYINISSEIDGNVEIKIGDLIFTKNVNGGKATVDLNGLSGGVKTAVVTFTSTDETVSLVTTTKFVVNRAQTVTDVAVDGRNIVINVTDGATGKLTVYINGAKQEWTYTGEDIVLTDALTIGNNTVIVFYAGNENFTGSENTTELTIPKNKALVNVTADSFVYGGVAEITVNVGAGQTGYVTVTVNNIPYLLPINDTQLIFRIPGLSVNNYPVSVKYSGDESFDSENNSTDFNVTKASLSTTVTVVGQNVTVSENTSFIIGVPSDFKGLLNITVDGVKYSGPVSSLVTMAKLASGNKTAEAVFWGDANYNDFKLNASFAVSRLPTVASVTVADVIYSNRSTAVITVSDNANGTVIITVNGVAYNQVNIVNGYANIDLGILSAGIKNATVIFTVSDSVNRNATATTRFAVNKLNTTTAIRTEGNNVTVNVVNGENAKLTVYVNGAKKEFTFDGTEIILENVLIIGNNTIVAVYEGNENCTGSENTAFEFIDRKNAIVNVTAAPITYGVDAVVVVRVGEGQTGYVTVNVNSKNYTAEIKDGGAVFNIPGLDAISYDVNVTYLGDENFTAQKNTTALIVNPADLNAVVVGENVTVNDNTSFVISNVPDSFKGMVNITVDGVIYSGIPKSLIKMSTLTAGDKKANVKFYGDDNYNGLELNVTFTVSRVSQSGTLMNVSVEDVSYGEGATAFITVSGKANGTVTVSVNGNEYGAVEVLNGSATVSLGILSAGVKNITARFTVSDSINANATANAKFAVEKASSAVSIRFENANVIVNVTPGETGDLTLYINGKQTKFTYSGEITVENILKTGWNTVVAIYGGSENYTSSQASKNITVDKKQALVNVTVDSAVYGSPATVTVNVPQIQTGYVTVTVNNVNYTSEIKDGKAVFTVTGLNAEVYDVNVTYSGDINFTSEVNSTTLTVNPAGLDATVSGVDVTTEQESKFIVNVPSDFKGKVNITVDGNTYSGDVQSVIVMNKLSEGSKTAHVIFFGDSNYNGLEMDVKFNVSEVSIASSILSIKSDNMTRGWNSEFDYQAAFLDSEGNALKNTQVTFKVNGKSYTATTNEDGIAHMLSKLDVGRYNVTSVNPVTGEEVTNSLVIVKRITENKDLVMDYRDGSVFKVKVFGDDGNIAPEGEIIDITANGVHYVAKVDKKGYASLKITLLPKKYTITAEYKGFKTTNKLTVKQVLKPVKKTVKVKKGKKITIKAKLAWSNGKGIKGKVITFKIKGKTFKAKTNNKGIAKVVIKNKKFLKKLKKGKKYKVTIAYTVKDKYGNGYVKVSDKVKCTVKIKK